MRFTDAFVLAFAVPLDLHLPIVLSIQVGPLPGAPSRPSSISLDPIDVNEYARAFFPSSPTENFELVDGQAGVTADLRPALEIATTGVKELRDAVARLYNSLHRQGKESQYTAENVCIVPGGRAGMSRVSAVVGDVYCGYQIPEYTAYSDSLSVFKRLVNANPSP